MYLVAAWTETSTPWSNERKPNGVAHELSMTTRAPRRCATAAIAGMSCTSKVSDPGDSVKTSFVFGAEFALDRRARQRIVVAHLDAEARQMKVAEPARRPVDGVGDERRDRRCARAPAAATSSR